jgi:hypothetical protein
MQKLKNLQKNIHTAAWLIALPPPIGADAEKWNEAVNALYKANEQIDKIIKEKEKRL